MNEQSVRRALPRQHWTFAYVNWYSFCFALTFLLYGGVKLVLAVLDRNYESLSKPVIFGLIGILVISGVYAFREKKPWGWFSQLIVHAAVILSAAAALLLGMSGVAGPQPLENGILLVLSAAAFVFLLLPPVKGEFR